MSIEQTLSDCIFVAAERVKSIQKKKIQLMITDSKWIYEGESVRYEITTSVPSVVIISGKRHEVDKGSYVFL